MIRNEQVSVLSFILGFCLWFLFFLNNRISTDELWQSSKIVPKKIKSLSLDFEKCPPLGRCLKKRKVLELPEYSIKSHSQICPSLAIPIVITACIGKEDPQTPNDWERKSTWNRQMEQIRTMLASLLLFSVCPKWRIIVVTDTWNTFFQIVSLASRWPRYQRDKLILERRQMALPDHPFLKKWRPCCWGKMFLHEMLPELDFIVYIDTDFLFVGPAEDLWQQINRMNDSQVVAYGPEPWYVHENASRKIAGNYGINTGIALMNITRAKQLYKDGYGHLLLQEISLSVFPRHDQDVANSFLSKHPELLMELSPRFNFHPAICSENVQCEDCAEEGIVCLHGSDASFYKFVDARIQVTYAIFLEFSRMFELKPQRLLRLLESQLNLTARNPHRFEACKNYTDFTTILLLPLRRLALNQPNYS